MPDSQATVIGNVTRDPELRYTATGRAMSTFGLAVNRRWQNKQTQEWEEEVSFFNVVCWADLAEHVCESISKGARVVVAGRLQQRSWEGDDGNKRSTVEVVADDVGASLRWATATIVKAERADRSTTSRAPAAAAPARSGAGGASYDDLGEPF